MIFGINTTSDISKLLYVTSRAVRRVKFESILKYHEWYLCQISRTNHAIICLYYYYPQKVVIFTCRYFKLSWNITALSQSNCRKFSCSIINSYIESLLCNVWRTNCFFFPLTQCISFCAKMALSFHRRPKEMKYYTHLLALSIILKKIFFRCRSAPYPVSNFLSVLKKCLLVNLILLFVRPD